MATRRLIRPTLTPSETQPAAEPEREPAQPERQPAFNTSRRVPEPRMVEPRRDERPRDHRQTYQKQMRPPMNNPRNDGGGQPYQPRPQQQPQQRGGGNGGPQQHRPHQQHQRHGGGGHQQRRNQLDNTFAESFYYLKQMKARTPMVIVMENGEAIKGTIEWYDRACIKVAREEADNIILFKRYIRYMHKDPDRQAPEMPEGPEGRTEQD